MTLHILREPKNLVWIILLGFCITLGLLLGRRLTGMRVWCIGVAEGLRREVEKYQWMWATNGDLSKLLGTPISLHLE